MKKTNTPKKGAIAVAEYVINGQVRKIVKLGEVTRYTKKYFFHKDGEGNTIKREYNYTKSNGVRIKYFLAD